MHSMTIMPEGSLSGPNPLLAPSHRHAGPSGPWPFLDLSYDIDTSRPAHKSPLPPVQRCDHRDAATCNGCWAGYPQSLFPNWTPAQQKRSRISKVVERVHDTCTIHYVDVNEKGGFVTSESLVVPPDGKDAHWERMRQPRPKGTRLRAMFLENLSGPVLQMLGTKYNIEPFYFSSSIGWIPSRYEEEVKPGQSDHITISLTFLRTTPPTPFNVPRPSNAGSPSTAGFTHTQDLIPRDQLNTQSSLSIWSRQCTLFTDLLSLHMVRTHTNSTIISYHPGQGHLSTTASSLHSRFEDTGGSVYWSKMLAQYDDPTFLLFPFLWIAFYAWDEALQVLFSHICLVESHVLHTTDAELTQELYVIQAHLLHYASILDDFRKTVVFVLETPYPGLDNSSLYTPEHSERSKAAMKKECERLLGGIERLEKTRVMQGIERLKNVMNLGFSRINIEDNQHMQRLTEAAVIDSAAMKQLAYLTMFLLPAALVAAIFGMNVKEFNPESSNTFAHYLAYAIPLTIATCWMTIAFHPGYDVNKLSLVWRILRRIGWPVFKAWDWLSKKPELERLEAGQARQRGVI